VGIVAIPLRIGCECPNDGLSPITRPGSENFTHIVTSGLGYPSGTDPSWGILARFSRMNCAERMWGDKALRYSLQVGWPETAHPTISGQFLQHFEDRKVAEVAPTQRMSCFEIPTLERSHMTRALRVP
jgi:hypothetical protein